MVSPETVLPVRVYGEDQAPAPRWLDGTKRRFVEWLWSHWLPKDRITLICGPGSIGKGSVCLEVALAVAGEMETYPDGIQLAPPKGMHSVLYMAYEDEEETGLDQRMVAFGVSRRANILIHPTLASTDPFLAIDDLMAQNTGPPVGLIVIDPLVNMIGRMGLDENNNAEMTALMERLAAVASTQHCAILIAHHTRKQGILQGEMPLQDTIRGASAIVNSARTAWLLVYGSREDSDLRLMGKPKANLGLSKGVVVYRMTPWIDSDDPRYNAGTLKEEEYLSDVTLAQEVRARAKEEKGSASQVVAQEVLTYLRRPDVSTPILLHDLAIVFSDTPDKQMRAALRWLETEGLIGKHPLTKNEAKEHGWEWRQHQFVLTPLDGTLHD